MKKHIFLFLFVFLFIFSPVANSLARGYITDLPPKIYSGEISEFEIIAIDDDKATFAISRLCSNVGAACVITNLSGQVPLISYTCTGGSRVCWQAFLAAVESIGFTVSVIPASLGASFVFVFNRSSYNVRSSPSRGDYPQDQ